MGIEELRKQIDSIDQELVALLNRRAAVVVEVGKLKNTSGAPIYAPDREKAVLEKICKANQGAAARQDAHGDLAGADERLIRARAPAADRVPGSAG